MFREDNNSKKKIKTELYNFPLERERDLL